MAATRICVRLNGYEQPFKLIRVVVISGTASGKVLIYQPAARLRLGRARAERETPGRGDGRLREAVT